MTADRPSRNEGGFTALEVLIAAVIMVIGLLTSTALLATTLKANRFSRELDHAKLISEQTMESLRSSDVATLQATQGTLTTVTGSEGTVYTPSFAVTALTGQTGIVLVTVTTTFAENGDATDTHSAKVQMIRTTSEKL